MPEPNSQERGLGWWLYPLVLLIVVSGWAILVTAIGAWHLYAELWQMAVTMVFGSFVAGATPAGGGSVAFPVFTKLFEVPSTTARTFSLMIQSVGMTMASLFILSRGIQVSWPAIRWCFAGGIGGFLLSYYCPGPSEPYPRLLFTILVVVFGVALSISHYGMGWRPRLGDDSRLKGLVNHAHIVAVGILGGYVSGLIGSGIDLLGFTALTLAYGFHERLAVPTTVIVMAALSLFGASFFAIMDHPTVEKAFPLWLVCVPVVAIGAPFGAWFVSRIQREVLIVLVLLLIVLEAITTTILIGFTKSSALSAAAVAVFAAVYFAWMIRLRGGENPEKLPESRP
ncbi:MAG: sulfite exporter TauE/SafE family protein [Verrucomicrobiota bacterium]